MWAGLKPKIQNSEGGPSWAPLLGVTCVTSEQRKYEESLGRLTVKLSHKV